MNTGLLTELQTLEYVADIHSFELKFLPSSLLLLIIGLKFVFILDHHRLIRLLHHITLVNKLLMVQPFVRVAHVATIVHCSADDVLIVKNKTIVSFALQVVLNLYFSFVFRLIFHDCEELLATLTLFVGEAGAATRISETVFTDVFRVIGLFMFLFEAFFGRIFLRGDLIT